MCTQRHLEHGLSADPFASVLTRYRGSAWRLYVYPHRQHDTTATVQHPHQHYTDAASLEIHLRVGVNRSEWLVACSGLGGAAVREQFGAVDVARRIARQEERGGPNLVCLADAAQGSLFVIRLRGLVKHCQKFSIAR